jgi:predicted permease
MLERKLPATFPTDLAQFLLWVGVPISIVAFLRETDLSQQIWIALVIAYLAILLEVFLAWLVIKGQAFLKNSQPQPSTQASLILASMLGNTGYLDFPITLAMVGKEYFAWALFYDLLGSVFGAYGLGVLLATRFGNTIQNHGHMAKAILINPALWSFGYGLLFSQVAMPNMVEIALEKLAWCAIALSLILIGMRLSRLNSWYKLKPAGISLFIKMLSP